MKLLKNITTALLVFVACYANAQQPVITGTWTLIDKTQISGQEYANAIPVKLQFSAAGNEMTLIRTDIGTDEDTPGASNTEKLLLEKGKATVGETADKRQMVTGAFLAGSVLTETKTISEPATDKVRIKIKETSTISPDGKTLTLVKEFENLADANDKWSVKGIYQKQP